MDREKAVKLLEQYTLASDNMTVVALGHGGNLKAEVQLDRARRALATIFKAMTDRDITTAECDRILRP